MSIAYDTGTKLAQQAILEEREMISPHEKAMRQGQLLGTGLGAAAGYGLGRLRGIQSPGGVPALLGGLLGMVGGTLGGAALGPSRRIPPRRRSVKYFDPSTRDYVEAPQYVIDTLNEAEARHKDRVLLQGARGY